MRGYELHDAVTAMLEGLTVDDAADAADRFRYDEDWTPDEVRPERSFLLLQGQLSPTETVATNTKSTTLSVLVHYSDGPRVGRRMIADGERIQQALHAFHGGRTYTKRDGTTGTVPSDVHATSDIGDWVPGTSGVGQVTCQIDFRLSYSLTGV